GDDARAVDLDGGHRGEHVGLGDLGVLAVEIAVAVVVDEVEAVLGRPREDGGVGVVAVHAGGVAVAVAVGGLGAVGAGAVLVDAVAAQVEHAGPPRAVGVVAVAG